MTSQPLATAPGDSVQHDAAWAVAAIPEPDRANQPKDLLYGVPAIAEFLGLTERQARHQCETGRLPTFKMGAIICARRSTVTTWLAEQEAKARKAAAA